ncbi:guanylyl and adenylyl cyclase family member, partial [Volvox carteri f. nagariensis]
GFTPMCKEVEPRAVMVMLNELFTRFDALLDVFGVRKVETIGDAYFVAVGAPRRVASSHALSVIGFAKAMLSAARHVSMPTDGQPVQIRIGIHTGPALSGLLGRRMPRFCLFGGAVATAARMESTGVPGAVHISEATYRLL